MEWNWSIFLTKDGTTILENSDLAVMDKCGFQHGNFVKPLLRDILQEHGISLLFQPVYLL